MSLQSEKKRSCKLIYLLFLCYIVTAKKKTQKQNKTFYLRGKLCDMQRQPLQRLRASVQWKPWSLILGYGCVFLSSFKLGYYITYMHRVADCTKARKVLFSLLLLSFKANTNCLVRFDSHVNCLFGQVLSILRACDTALLAASRKCCSDENKK